MEHARRNLFLLAGSQALLLTNNATLIAVNGLAGFALADDKALATLPVAVYVVGAAVATLPASLWMRRVGRRNGFLTGALFGLAGAAIAALGILLASFWTLVAGTFVLGTYNAFGQYHRFAAADAAPPAWKAKAISLVMAGGLVGGIVGPELSKHTRELWQPTFLASYVSLIGLYLVGMAILAGLRLPEPKDEPVFGTARALSQIASQPVFVVAAGSSAIGYGVMHLLMAGTPLAMGLRGLPYEASAGVISAHVIAMFGPSFFTGSLIQSCGVLRVMLAGVAALFASVAIGLSGQHHAHFWWSMVLLGIGWNFMYVGGTTLLTEAYRPSEKAVTQGANETIVFATTAAGSFASGALVNSAGWNTLNQIALPFIALAGAAVLWLALTRRVAAAAN